MCKFVFITYLFFTIYDFSLSLFSSILATFLECKEEGRMKKAAFGQSNTVVAVVVVVAAATGTEVAVVVTAVCVGNDAYSHCCGYRHSSCRTGIASCTNHCHTSGSPDDGTGDDKALPAAAAVAAAGTVNAAVAADADTFEGDDGCGHSTESF